MLAQRSGLGCVDTLHAKNDCVIQTQRTESETECLPSMQRWGHVFVSMSHAVGSFLCVPSVLVQNSPGGVYDESTRQMPDRATISEQSAAMGSPHGLAKARALEKRLDRYGCHGLYPSPARVYDESTRQTSDRGNDI